MGSYSGPVQTEQRHIGPSFTARPFGTKPSITDIFNDPYKYEIRRFETYPRDMDDQMVTICARNGFYYIHSTKHIQCYSCGLRIKVPAQRNEKGFIELHRTLSRDECPFLKNEANNVPFNDEDESHRISSSQSSNSSDDTVDLSEPMVVVGGDDSDCDIVRTSGDSNSSSPSSSSSSILSSSANSSSRSSDSDNGDVVRRRNNVVSRRQPEQVESQPIRANNNNSSGSVISRIFRRPNNNSSSVQLMEPAVNGSFTRHGRDFEALKSESNRLETFSLPPGWPVTFIQPEECAKAGFFFLQDGDKVQCAFCRGVAGEWEEGDVPLTEHRRHFPRCPFVCNLPVGNIPAGQEMEEASRLHDEEEARGIDVCGTFPSSVFRSSGSSSGSPQGSQNKGPSGAQPLSFSGDNNNEVASTIYAIKTCGNGPVHPSLVTQPARVKTFENWPVTTGQSAEAMADAGFFHIGRFDHVKCFYCDGGLRNWEPKDDPWFEHARWFPKCTFVVLNKGAEYIKEVTKTRPPVVPKEYLNTMTKNSNSRTPRRVTDQQLRNLMDTPIVQAALEMGMELGKVKGALQRKIQQTGQPFVTTEALLEAILGGRDPEYESDPDDDDEDEEFEIHHEEENEYDDEDEDEIMSGYPRPRNRRRSMPAPNANSNNNVNSRRSSVPPQPPSSQGESLASSAEQSSGSGDEEGRLSPATSSGISSGAGASAVNSQSESEEEMNPKVPAERCPSGDSGISESVAMMTNESSSESERVQEELRKLREATQCKICMDSQVGVVFLPCGHLVSCTNCATALSNCALCRKPIKAFVRTYLS